MSIAPAIHQPRQAAASRAAANLEADTLFDWLGLTPGQKVVATRINADTGVLLGLRISMKQKVDGRQIAIALDSYAVAPQTGAKTDPLLRLTFAVAPGADLIKLRQVQWRGQRVSVAANQLEPLLEDVARISLSLRRQYLPAVSSLDTLLSAAVTEKDA